MPMAGMEKPEWPFRAPCHHLTKPGLDGSNLSAAATGYVFASRRHLSDPLIQGTASPAPRFKCSTSSNQAKETA